MNALYLFCVLCWNSVKDFNVTSLLYFITTFLVLFAVLQHDKWLLNFLLKIEYIKFPFLCSFLLFFYHCDNVVLQEYCWVLYLYLCTNVYSFKYPFMFAFIYIFILDWYVVHCRYFVVVYYLSLVFEVIIFIPTATLKCLNESFPGIIKIRLFIFFTKFLQISLNLN